MDNTFFALILTLIFSSCAYANKPLNDPTMPKITNEGTAPIVEEKNPTTTQTTSGKLKLSMIIIKDKDKTAVINDQMVREKDKVFGYEVTKIERNKVTLKKSKAPLSTSSMSSISSKELDTFTELKLPSITVKSFLVSPKTTKFHK